MTGKSKSSRICDMLSSLFFFKKKKSEFVISDPDEYSEVLNPAASLEQERIAAIADVFSSRDDLKTTDSDSDSPNTVVSSGGVNAITKL